MSIEATRRGVVDEPQMVRVDEGGRIVDGRVVGDAALKPLGVRFRIGLTISPSRSISATALIPLVAGRGRQVGRYLDHRSNHEGAPRHDTHEAAYGRDKPRPQRRIRGRPTPASRAVDEDDGPETVRLTHRIWRSDRDLKAVLHTFAPSF